MQRSGLCGFARLPLAVAALEEFDDLQEAEGDDEPKAERDQVDEHGLAAEHERHATSARG
jgi:hypothetical protein